MKSRKSVLAQLTRNFAFLLTSLGCTGAHAQGADETVWPTPDWQTSSPEVQGIDSADLATLVAFGKTKSFDSFLIVRHGKIALDAYYAPYAADVPHVNNSATKAIVSSSLQSPERMACSTASIIPCLISSPIATWRTSMSERRRSRSRTSWT
jgi:hypothetical protein